MNNYVNIINQYPLQSAVAFVMIGSFIAFLPYFFLYIFSNSLDLELVTSFTNNKEIRNSFIDFAKVKRNYVFSLFFLDCSNDCFDDFRTLSEPFHTFYSAGS